MHVREIKDLYSRIINSNPENEIEAILEELSTISVIKNSIKPDDKIPIEARVKLMALLTRFLENKISDFDVAVTNPRFRDYRRDYYRSIRNYQISSQEELWQAVDNAGIISVADFHFAHETKFFLLMLLQKLLKTKQQVKLCLEPILSSEQSVLENYLSKRSNHAAFSGSISSYNEDPLSFEFDRVIYEFIKEQPRIKAIGIDIRGDLLTRDRNAGIIIVNEKELHPEIPIVVFGGDLHFAQSHLPAEINKRTNAKQVIIYQNIPKMYYDLLRKELDTSTAVVKCNGKGFYVPSISPLELAVAHIYYKNKPIEELDFIDRSYHENAADLLRLTYALTKINLKDFVVDVKDLYQGSRVLKEIERDAA